MAKNYVPKIPWTAKYSDTAGYDCMTGGWIILEGTEIITVIDEADHSREAAESIAHTIVAAINLEKVHG